MSDPRTAHHFAASLSVDVCRSLFHHCFWDQPFISFPKSLRMLQEWVVSSYSMYQCGAITNSTLVYDPTANSYSVAPDMPRPRYRHSAVAVGNSMYVLGGTNLNEEHITEVDVFDTETATWSTLTGAPLASSTTDGAAFAVEAKIYFTGGYNLPNYDSSNRTFCLDTANLAGGWQEVKDALEQRGDHAAVTIKGKGYVFGGFTHTNNWENPLSTLESYDPTSNTWSKLKSMPTIRGDKAGAVLNSRFQVIGGETKDSQGNSVPVADVEVFDPALNVWVDEGKIPSKRFRFVAAAHGDSVYIFGGQGYLVGTAKTVGSYYPLVDTVEAFQETRTEIVSGEALTRPFTHAVLAAIWAITAVLM